MGCKIMARIVNVFVKPMITKAVTKDMDTFEAWCEAQWRGNGAAAPLVDLRLGRLPGLRFPIPNTGDEARR